MKKRTLFITITLIITLSIILGIYAIYKQGWNYWEIRKMFSSPENFRSFILGYGVWAPLAFFIAQILQVIISPIPGNITGLVGGALFGCFKGFLLNSSGVLLGSIIAFFIARLFGQRIVIRLIGRHIFYKYNKIFHTKFIFGLFLIFLVPFFPDDALCFLAGLSTLPFPLFFLLIIFGRLPGMLVASLVGAGVMTFSLLQWAIIGIISLICIFFLLKYRSKIEIWFQHLIGINLTEEN